MTSQWWNNLEMMDDDQKRQRRRAFFDTFLAGASGRKVLAYLRLTAAANPTEAQEPALAAFEVQTRLNFVEYIRALCGPCDELTRLEAEAETASAGAEAGAPDTGNLKMDGFKEDGL